MLIAVDMLAPHSTRCRCIPDIAALRPVDADAVELLAAHRRGIVDLPACGRCVGSRYSLQVAPGGGGGAAA